jgi:hypothetical protein
LKEIPFILTITIANLVLEDASERIFVGNRYADIPLGLFLIRGDNLFLIGEMVSFFFQMNYGRRIFRDREKFVKCLIIPSGGRR